MKEKYNIEDYLLLKEIKALLKFKYKTLKRLKN